MITIKTKGIKETKDFFSRFSLMFEKQINKELGIMIKKLKKDIIDSMKQTPKDTSKTYVRGSRFHNPSMAGNPPAIDSGNLIANILTTVRPRLREAELWVTDDADYIKWLEDGTKLMEARPSILPAFEKIDLEDNVIAILQRSIYESK